MSKILKFPSKGKKQLRVDTVGKKIYTPNREFEEVTQESIDRIRLSLEEINHLMRKLKEQ